MDEYLTGHVGTNKIFDDLATKVLYGGSASSMCQICYMTSMIICENLCGNLRPTGHFDRTAQCVIAFSVGKY